MPRIGLYLGFTFTHRSSFGNWAGGPPFPLVISNSHNNVGAAFLCEAKGGRTRPNNFTACLGNDSNPTFSLLAGTIAWAIPERMSTHDVGR
jgi:hypothetical protein